MVSVKVLFPSALLQMRLATPSQPISRFAAVVLLLTPLAFLLSTARNCRQLADVLALVLGLALFPLAATLHTGVDILISGMSAGTIAYGVHWWREHDPENPVFRDDHAQNERTLESNSTQLNQTRSRE